MSDYIIVHGIRICKNYENFVPEKFGRLTTIGPRFWIRKGKQAYACHVCECSCGHVGVYCRVELVRGHTKSCTCMQREKASISGKKRRTHGCSNGANRKSDRHAEYAAWCSMKSRCYNENTENYPIYGGRGITVCDRWLCPVNGFANFLADMGPRPSPEHSLERKGVNGNYCPENCCWATVEEQSRNRRTNRVIEHNGESKCLVEWSEIYNIAAATISGRIRRGWSVHDAFTKPVDTRKWRKTKRENLAQEKNNE